MTILEQIAEKMGWVYFSAGGYPLNEIGKNWESVKALQARMVEDFYSITIRAFRNGQFEAEAFICHSLSPDTLPHRHIASADTEPAAIVELFKRVYGIKEGA